MRFQGDILASSITQDVNSEDVANSDTLVTLYNDTLCSLLDKYAPVQSRNITLRPHPSWYTDQLRQLKREKRRLERKYLSSGLTVDKEMYQQAYIEYARSLEIAKVDYYTTKVRGCNTRQLFKFVDEMLNVKAVPILPKHETAEELVEGFREHFE